MNFATCPACLHVITARTTSCVRPTICWNPYCLRGTLDPVDSLIFGGSQFLESFLDAGQRLRLAVRMRGLYRAVMGNPTGSYLLDLGTTHGRLTAIKVMCGRRCGKLCDRRRLDFRHLQFASMASKGRTALSSMWGAVQWLFLRTKNKTSGRERLPLTQTCWRITRSGV